MSDTNKENYDLIWENIILPEVIRYQKNVMSVSYKETTKDDILNSYKQLNNHCKKTYMADPEKRLDRHKVTACYMLAILEAEPLSFNVKCDEDILITINEHLAITVGLSILNAFINAKKTDDQNDISVSELNESSFSSV